MPSPEHKFQPQIVFAPDHKPGGITDGPQEEPPQHPHLAETSSPTSQLVKALEPHAPAVLGIAPDHNSNDGPTTHLVPPTESVPGDAAQMSAGGQEEVNQPRYVRPIVGGSERKIHLTPEELLALYKDGMSVQELAYQFGVTNSTIYKWLHKKGAIDTYWKEERKKKQDEWRKNRARELGLDENSTSYEIGAFLDQQGKKRE